MSFDRLAPMYRGMEWVLAGGKLQRCRLAWLDEVRDCRQVLIVGEGPGRFLAECVQALPKAQILCVDASAGMLDQARKSLLGLELDIRRVSLLQATLPQWSPPPGQFDLIVTHFFLDCFPPAELSQVIGRLATAARPGARWLVADFCIPEQGIARLRAQAILALAYRFFRVVTRLPASQLAPPDPVLELNGFRLAHRQIYDLGLLHSDLWISLRADR